MQSMCNSEVDSGKLQIYGRNKEYLDGKWLTDADEQQKKTEYQDYIEILVIGGSNRKKMEEDGEQQCTETSWID